MKFEDMKQLYNQCVNLSTSNGVEQSLKIDGLAKLLSTAVTKDITNAEKFRELATEFVSTTGLSARENKGKVEEHLYNPKVLDCFKKMMHGVAKLIRKIAHKSTDADKFEALINKLDSEFHPSKLKIIRGKVATKVTAMKSEATKKAIELKGKAGKLGDRVIGGMKRLKDGAKSQVKNQASRLFGRS